MNMFFSDMFCLTHPAELSCLDALQIQDDSERDELSSSTMYLSLSIYVLGYHDRAKARRE
jgi:hypothetical protein